MALKNAFENLATESGLGTDGASPPTIAGTGIRGWLRGIYEKLTGTLSVKQSGVTFTASTGNSSIANIAAGASFVGAIEDAFNQPAAQVMIGCDQPYTVVINQFQDAAGLVLLGSNTFTRAAGKGLNENVKIPGNFFQVIVTNTGSAPTAAFALQTSYGPLETLPNTLTNSGNLRVALMESAAPQPFYLAGQAGTDLAGIDILSELLDDNGDFGLQTRIRNLPRQDAIGAQLASDAPSALVGVATAANQNLLVIDTQGYASVSLELAGTWAGTVSFYANNSGVTPTNLIGAYPSSPAAAPVTAVTANGSWIIPAINRFIFVRCTAFASGNIQAIAYLRSQSATPILSTQSVNVAQLAGTVAVNAGVAGTQAVGGNVAPGSAPTLQPVNVGGVDAAGLLRRIQTDSNGASVVSGLDPQSVLRRVAIDQQGRLIILNAAMLNPAPGDDSSPADLLRQILTELRVMTYFMREMPAVLNGGVNFTDDPMSLRNDFSNLQN